MRLLWLSIVALGVSGACNKPPGTPGVSISPELPTTEEDLILDLVEAVDPNKSDVVTHTIRWFLNGEEQIILEGAELVESARTNKGEVWSVEVLPADDKEWGPKGIAEVVIQNTAPEGSVSIRPEAPLASEDLVAEVTATDVDRDETTFTFTWTVDGEVTEWDTETVPASATEKGQRWEVSVVISDGEVDSEPLVATVDIQNSAPVVTIASLSPADIYEDSLVRALVSASDPDGDAVELSYLWVVDGVSLTELAADQNSLDGASFDKGQSISVEVTVSDGYVDGEVMVLGPEIVQNSPPSLDSATVTPAESYEDTVIECAGAGFADIDGDEAELQYAWTVDGVVAATGSPTIDGTDFDKGQQVVCVVTPFDGEDTGTPVESDAITILNSKPELSAATLNTLSPKEGDTLSVTVGTSRDLDGDRVTFDFNWYVSGTMVKSGTDPKLDSSYFSKGNAVYAEVLPYDGEEYGDPVYTSTATVANTAPVGDSVSFTETSVYTNDTVMAVATGSDVDGDSLSWSYAWSVNGTVISGVSGNSLSGVSHFDKGDRVIVVATPNDGDADGSSVTSSVLTVLNTAPTRPTVAISPASPGDADDLVCLVSTASFDEDGDTIRYIFEWTLDGSIWSGSTSTTTWTGDTISSSDTASGDTWLCTVTPEDSDESGASDSASVVVGSSLPSLVVDGGTTTLTEGTYDYSTVEIINGGTLRLSGLVEINATSFDLDSTSRVDGSGGGDSAERGTGAGGGSVAAGGGGGGYGGTGGRGGYDAADTPGAGGSTYGSMSSTSISPGSGGGNCGTGGVTGGNGGAALYLFAETVVIDGRISVDGAAGVFDSFYGRAGGGGSGGGVLVWGDDVTLTGSISARGGAGGSGTATYNDGGGGGGGGRLKVFYDTNLTLTGTVIVTGGSGGLYGDAGYGVTGSTGSTHRSNVGWPGL